MPTKQLHSTTHCCVSANLGDLRIWADLFNFEPLLRLVLLG